MEKPPSILSRARRYSAVPSLTVGVQPELPRGDGKLTPNPGARGGLSRGIFEA